MYPPPFSLSILTVALMLTTSTSSLTLALALSQLTSAAADTARHENISVRIQYSECFKHGLPCVNANTGSRSLAVPRWFSLPVAMARELASMTVSGKSYTARGVPPVSMSVAQEMERDKNGDGNGDGDGDDLGHGSSVGLGQRAYSGSHSRVVPHAFSLLLALVDMISSSANSLSSRSAITGPSETVSIQAQSDNNTHREASSQASTAVRARYTGNCDPRTGIEGICSYPDPAPDPNSAAATTKNIFGCIFSLPRHATVLLHRMSSVLGSSLPQEREGERIAAGVANACDAIRGDVQKSEGSHIQLYTWGAVGVAAGMLVWGLIAERRSKRIDYGIGWHEWATRFELAHDGEL